MPHENLLHYIRDNKDKATRPEIEKVLIQAGWKLEDILASFEVIDNPGKAAAPGAVPGTAIPADLSEAARSQAFLEEMRRQRGELETPAATVADPYPLPTKKKSLYAARGNGPGGIVGLLIRLKVVQTESQANIVLVGIFFVAIGLAGYIMYKTFFGGAPKSTLTPAQQQQYIDRMKSAGAPPTPAP